MSNFQWDEVKNEKNKSKHGISFEHALDIFNDDNRLQSASDKNGERRYQTIGKAYKVVITVVYTIRDFAYRLISARTARKDEREKYLKKALTQQDDEYGRE